MDKKRSQFVPGDSFASESLERRIVLSGTASQGVAEVASQAVRKAATTTNLMVGAGTLGQPITLTATVQADTAAGSPTGTVNILDHGQVIRTLTLSPTTLSGALGAASQATATLTPPPGGASYFFGTHKLTAVFIPGGAYKQSTAGTTFTVGQPTYTSLAGGVKIATIAQGSGPRIQAGQAANMLYTGYLAKNGKVFDDSLQHGGAPFSFSVGAGQVIPGFDAGTVGMQAGETRLILIPPAQGYGARANGAIPGNSTLIFAVTLESIS